MKETNQKTLIMQAKDRGWLSDGTEDPKLDDELKDLGIDRQIDRQRRDKMFAKDHIVFSENAYRSIGGGK